MNRFHQTLVALALTACGSAFAQTSIDQNKALAGGVTPGDTAGFPITISQPGHYVLKSNLQVPVGAHGIVITAPDVTLDLNGFTVAGPATCTRDEASAEVSCTQFSQTEGIALGGDNVRVINGTVRGFYFGVRAITFVSAHLSDVTATQNNRGVALLGNATSRALVTRVHAHLNKSDGITASGSGVLMSQITAVGNGGVGVGIYNGVLQDSVVDANRGGGVMGSGAVKGVVAGWNKGSNFTSGFLVSLGGNLDRDTGVKF